MDSQDNAERIEKGISITKEAIANKDIKRLKECLNLFPGLATPQEKLTEAIAGCPVSLFQKAGFGLEIDSARLGRRIVLGRDIDWAEVVVLLIEGVKGDALKDILEAREIFEGKIVSKRSLGLFGR